MRRALNQALGPCLFEAAVRAHLHFTQTHLYHPSRVRGGGEQGWPLSRHVWFCLLLIFVQWMRVLLPALHLCALLG